MRSFTDNHGRLSPRRPFASGLRPSRFAYPRILLLLGLFACEGGLLVRHLQEHTNFDEGVYLNSLRALESGWRLGGEVFASQPPGFYLLLRADAHLLGHSLDALRLGFAAVELVGCVSAFVIAHLFGGFRAGLAASLLFATSTPLLTIATHISADGPGTSLALAAVAVLMYGWHRRATSTSVKIVWSAFGGALFAFAVSVKLDAATAIAAAAAVALWRHPARASIAAAVLGAVVVFAGFAVEYADVRTQLWNSVIALHLDARNIHDMRRTGGTAGFAANLRHIADAFNPTSKLMPWVLALGVVSFVLEGRRRARTATVLLAWPVVAFAFLLSQRPLFSEHMVLLAGAIAPPAGVGLARLPELLGSRARRTTVRSAVSLLVAGAAVQLFLLPVRTETSSTLADAKALRAHSRPGQYVVATDVPAAAFLANRNVPPTLVDTSWVRILSGSLQPLQITSAIREFDVTVALVGPRLLSSKPALGQLRSFYRRSRQRGSAVIFFDPRRHSTHRRPELP